MFGLLIFQRKIALINILGRRSLIQVAKVAFETLRNMAEIRDKQEEKRRGISKRRRERRKIDEI